jgi:hypothetical protein
LHWTEYRRLSKPRVPTGLHGPGASPAGPEQDVRLRITVAIPTIAGRERYLAASLRSCTTQDHPDLEILVSDNSVEHGARAVVEASGDPRVRYVHPPRYLPMSRHWDFVLSEARGELLCIIGDDDGLMPGCIDRVAELARRFPSQIVHHSLGNYFWPDYHNQGERNSILLFHPVGRDAVVVRAADVLRGLCEGRLRYVDGPMAYHNFVPTALMRGLSRDGAFFRRPWPDVYSSVALAANVDTFVSTQECLTISGQGARANGASVASGGSDGRKFLAESRDAYRPRFESRTIQLSLLDCILECAQEFTRPAPSDIPYAAHLRAALREMRSFPGLASKLHEFGELVNAASRLRVLGPFWNDAARALLRGVRRAAGAMPAPTGANGRAPLVEGSRLNLPSSVADVYRASLAFDETIRAATA